MKILIKISMAISLILVLSIIIYWNVHYIKIVIENENFAQITGMLLILIPELYIIIHIIKVFLDEITN